MGCATVVSTHMLSRMGEDGKRVVFCCRTRSLSGCCVYYSNEPLLVLYPVPGFPRNPIVATVHALILLSGPMKTVLSDPFHLRASFTRVSPLSIPPVASFSWHLPPPAGSATQAVTRWLCSEQSASSWVRLRLPRTRRDRVVF